jgi:hypothetical protein
MRAGDAAAPFVGWVTWAKLLNHRRLSSQARCNRRPRSSTSSGSNRFAIDSPAASARPKAWNFLELRFATDSTVEGTGFEPSVPSRDCRRSDLTRDLEARGSGYLRLPHRRDVDNRKVVAHLADAMRWCKSMPERGKHFEALHIPTTAWAALAASPRVTSLPNAP